MKTHLIENFTGHDQIKISVADSALARNVGGLVHIIQHSASLRFQHDISPSEARKMASALIEAAYEAEEYAAQAAA